MVKSWYNKQLQLLICVLQVGFSLFQTVLRAFVSHPGFISPAACFPLMTGSADLVEIQTGSHSFEQRRLTPVSGLATLFPVLLLLSLSRSRCCFGSTDLHRNTLVTSIVFLLHLFLSV